MAEQTEPEAFAQMGEQVLISSGENLAAWTEEGGLMPLGPTPEQYTKFNGGYLADPDPELAAKALAAFEADPPTFDRGENLADPDVLDMSGPKARPKRKRRIISPEERRQ